ncbi:glycosyltransferase family 4 protein [Pontibacter brevis]
MNIFVIPSWYPSKDNPIAGIFFKEQASYLAELYDNTHVGISLWGQNDADFAINRKLLPSLKALYHYTRANKKTCINSLKANLHEVFTPVLNLPVKVLGGNISAILKANFANFRAYQEQFGRIDIIHAHVSYPAGYIAMVLAEHFKIPYLITEHMGPFPFKDFLTRDGQIKHVLSLPINRANKVIAVSPRLRDDITRFNLQQPLFIPNVINEDFFVPKETVKHAPFQFFTLATLSPEKGIDDLLRAVSLVVKTHKNVKFKIGGGGSLLNHYKEKTSTLGLEQHVEWMGELTRSEAREQYQHSHAFVLPSHGETFGVVYAEAIACGIPVIATRCGGPECIVDEENGLLANVKDPQDLADKIEYMLHHYETYDSEKTRKGFEARFSKKVVIPQIMEVYQSLLRTASE